MAELPVGPDLAGDALGVGAVLPPALPTDFGVADTPDRAALGETAELPVGPGLTGDVLGVAVVPPLAPAGGFDGSLGFGVVEMAAGVALGATADMPVGPGLAGDALGVADVPPLDAAAGFAEAGPAAGALSAGRSVGLRPSSFDAVTDVSSPSDRVRTACGQGRPIDWRP